MTKRKLQHFAETAAFKNFIQLSFEELKDGFYLKGKWCRDFFNNSNPLVLELGCGKGEYTVGLAQLNPDKNYIGIDIKGARMWRGAKTAHELGISNVGFLRTQINLIANFFAEDEVSELWITFPDPYPKASKERKRLTSPWFLEMYKKILVSGGIIHLKTDNSVFFDYTLDVIKENGYRLIYSTKDLYNSGNIEEVIQIQTFYENMFLKIGIPICYLKFKLS